MLNYSCKKFLPFLTVVSFLITDHAAADISTDEAIAIEKALSARRTSGPTVGGVPVEIKAETSGVTQISFDGKTISFKPVHVSTEFAKVSDKVHVAAEQHASTVVEGLKDGLRATTVIKDSVAPTEYRYALDGAKFEVLEDGAIGIIDDDTGKQMGFVWPAWAVDAQGASVPTSYEIANGELVQHVMHAHATYPVVADPQISFGRYIYVRYSQSEVQNGISVVENIAEYAPFVCTPLLYTAATIPIAPFCVKFIKDQHTSVKDTWIKAADRNQCMELRFMYVTYAVVGWNGYDC